MARHLTSIPTGLFTFLTGAASLWLTLAPHPLPGSGLHLFPGADKVVHACMFGGLFFAACFDRKLWRTKKRAMHQHLTHRPEKRYIILSIALNCVAFGGGIELVQGAMDLGRGADWLDFLADAAGVAVAMALTPRVLGLLFSSRH